jgi:acetoin utilization deacetylase AcuC-like enzyme
MITRDALAEAVKQIGSNDPQLGGTLAAMLADGRLTPAGVERHGADAGAPVFVLDGELVAVRRHQYIHQGLPALVEKLVLAAAQQEAMLQQPTAEFGWQCDRLRREARRAALNRLLDFRLDEETHHYQAVLAREPLDRHASAGLTLLEDLHGEFPGDVLPWNPAHGSVFFKGVVEVDTSALFVQLPMTRDALLQIADRDLEFFNLNHVLDVVRRGEHRRLFACVVHGRLAGMMEVGVSGGSGFEDLEIRYLATAQGDPEGSAQGRDWAHRGAGAMMLAGAWLLWKIYEPALANLVVCSEPGAVGFYESLGFVHAQPHVFRLEDPRGHFLRNIVAMANRRESLPVPVKREISFLVRRQARALIATEASDVGASDAVARPEVEARRTAGAFFFEECFRAKRSLPWAAEAVAALVERGQGLPWCEELLRSAHEYGLVRVRDDGVATPPLLLVIDDRFAGHYEHNLSFESGKRLRALLEVLDDPGLEGRWRKVPVRQAKVSELRTIHTSQHVQRCVGTFGPRIVPAGEEILASERVQDTALFAVGGLLNLLDEIMAGRGEHGFALVRPPGHHAEPDRAMGFCFFNNVALGAQHLLATHGLSRVLIVDIDAHHGNGTQVAFHDRADVLYASIHRDRAYPFTGAAIEVGEGRGRGYTVNVPIDRRVGDLEYAALLRHLLWPIARRYQPEFILVSCGFDLHRSDPIGELELTDEGYRWIADLLLRMSAELCRGRIAWVLEGGYSVAGIKAAGLRVLRRLAGLDLLTEDDLARLDRVRIEKVPGIKRVLEVQGEFWPLGPA